MDKYKKLGVKIGKGWERSRRKHFDEIVLKYDKARWDYPNELFEDIIAYQGAGNCKSALEISADKRECKKALEIGAGTGKATVPFLDAGYNVTAVELGANMASFLQEKFSENERFNVIVSAFEDVSLENNSYDLIYAASAFHWVDSEIGCPKVFRVLKSGGAFALFRSNVIPADGDALYEDMQNVYKRIEPESYERPIVKDNFWSPVEILRGFGFDDLSEYGFTDISMKLYEAVLVFSAEDYINLMDTMSDNRSLPDKKRTALYNGMKEAIIKHGGFVSKNHVFQLYMGRKQ